MEEILRVAICQLTCHPAIYVGHQMWLEEPFIQEDRKCTLSYLSIRGFKVEDLLLRCKNTYLEWHSQRIMGVLGFLKTLTPPPSIVVFPEGAIPFQCLSTIQAYSSENEVTVFAGTHSLQRLKELTKIYKSIGVKDASIQKLLAKGSELNGVAAIFVHGKVFMAPKRLFSPFESTDISSMEIPSQAYFPYHIPFNDKKIAVLPLICSEALNFTKLKIKGDYDLCVIMSYDPTPNRFKGVTDMLVSNKKAVVYCNDGQFGGSALCIPVDDRRPFWWFASPCKGQLPKGDAILVTDIDIRNMGIEVGVSTPKKNFSLVKVSSITYDKEPTKSVVSKEIYQIGKIEDTSERADAIKSLINRRCGDELQCHRLDFLYQLAKTGRDTEDWWRVIGDDCVINLHCLEQMEQVLSKECYEELYKGLLEYGNEKEGIDDLRGFLLLAKSQIESAKGGQIPLGSDSKEIRSIINREEDGKEILSFLDDQRQRVTQISGLQQIGKSVAIQKALGQWPHPKIIEIEVNESSSADYIACKILPNLLSRNLGKNGALTAHITEQEFTDIFNSFDILWIHNAEKLLQTEDWRNAEIKNLIKMIILAASKSTVKIIFETRKELQLELQDPSIYFRKRIYGLERRYKAHGISYLEYQLRRNGISPQDLDDHLKEEIVDKLGGHPVAIALCADAIYDEGITRVMEILKQRKGFYLNFIKSILRNIDLSDDERMILNLLSGCKLSLPREAILGTFDYPVVPYLRNLIQLCMIEVDPASNIRLPGLLESFFDIEVIPVEIRKRFHRNCSDCYKGLFVKNKARIEYAIEADLHASLGDVQSNLSGQLVDSQLAIAQKLYDKQDYKTAQAILDKILTIKSTKDILRLSALVDAKCNNFESALNKAKIVFRLNLHDTWLLSEIARAALSQRRDDIAEELIGIAKVANMEDTSILLVSGRMLLRRGELRDAEERFKDACKLTKRNAWPYYFLGKTYLRQGDIEKAIDVLFEGENFFYENDIRKVNVLTAIRTQLGIAYTLAERIDLASPILEGLFEDESDDPEVMRAYAFMSLKKEGIQRAHEAYKRLKEAEIKSSYDRSQYHLFYGLFYLGIGEKGKASEEFSKAHKADRNNVYVMMKLARTYFEMATESWIDGDVDIAKTYATDCGEVVKKILEFDYDNVTGRHLQEELYNKFEIELSKALD